jgi:sigma-B regulation protein RsbU (phosphoserine phosphatase)
VHFNARYVPSERIGGDFYNVFRIDENRIGFFIADVSGHGVPSAMITVFLKQEISYYAKDVLDNGRYSVVRPGEVLRRFNRSFIETRIGEGSYFVTVVYCIYDVMRRELRVSIAGHHALPVIRRRDGRLESIDIRGFPIGWFETDEDYEEQIYLMDSGDTLYLYTDGLLDAARREGCIDFEAVHVLLQKRNVETALDRLIRSYRKKKQTEKDDITLLTFTITDR